MMKRLFLPVFTLALLLFTPFVQAGLFKVNANVIIEGPDWWGKRPLKKQKSKPILFKHISANVNEVQLGLITAAGVPLDSPRISVTEADALAAATSADEFLEFCPATFGADYCGQLSESDAEVALALLNEQGATVYLTSHLESISPVPLVSPVVPIEVYQKAVAECTPEAFAGIYGPQGVERLQHVFGPEGARTVLQEFVKFCE